MDVEQLTRIGVADKGIRRKARRFIVRLLEPYFATILRELDEIRSDVAALHTHENESDVRALRNRLADIEDRLTARLDR